MNTSCGDTVKCRLDTGKSPIFGSQSLCTYTPVYIRTGVATVLGFCTCIYIYIYMYESTKGLNLVSFSASNLECSCTNSRRQDAGPSP